MFTKKRAQFFTDFVLMYSWTIVIVAIIVSLLALLLVSYSKLAPDICRFDQPLLCKDDFHVQSSGTAMAKVYNIYHSGIMITGARLADEHQACQENRICIRAEAPFDCHTGREGSGYYLVTGISSYIIEENSYTYLVIDCMGEEFKDGKKASFSINMNWWPASGSATYKKTVSGEILAKAE